MRGAALLLAVLVSAGVRVPDLNNQPTDPFDAPPQIKAVVLVFTSIDCPVSQRYAPEIRRVSEAFAARGVRFWMVYPNPNEAAEAIRTHNTEYAYPASVLRDPRQVLIKLAQATVTPEVAVFDRQRRLVYHGRIDDRFVKLGVERPAPTRHDLEEVLEALVTGAPVSHSSAPAVGCFIADLFR